MTAAVAFADPRRVDPDLRRKYDIRGPRYTSYPPATAFHARSAGDFTDRWRARNRLADDPGLALYVHVPFCRARCLFCGCHTSVGRTADTGPYLDAVEAEMRLWAEIVDPRRPMRQVAIGGGTPNALAPDEIDRLLAAIETTWTLAPEAERSVEVDPRTAAPARLDAFLDHGFNRYSLGVQDFDPGVLAHVRRGQDTMAVEQVVGHLRARDVTSINFDLIYGLPGQSLDTAAATVARVLALAPDRLALYSYAHVPWIHPHQRVLERAGLPDPDLKASIFLSMSAALVQAGYERIGMDHFARPGDPLAVALRDRTLRRNFMGYTTGRGLDLVAAGASAIASVGATYSQNHKDLAAYHGELSAGRLPVARGCLLSADDELRRELLLELFCTFHLDLDTLSARFALDARRYFARELEAIEPMAEDGLVTLAPGTVRVTELGRLFIRPICMTFDKYLDRAATTPVFSRAV